MYLPVSIYLWSSHIIAEYYFIMDQPGSKVVNPAARGQVNKENGYFPVPVRAWEFGLARLVR